MNEHTNGTNGNGAHFSNGNGNGHNKGIFDMAPKVDPMISKIVPMARREMCHDTRICEAARMFFCYLTDMSLLPGVNSRPGVVKFSDSFLASRFNVSDKTIRNWKRAVESTGRVWLTEKFMKNTFPQTVYNITAIVGQATLPFNSDSDDGSLPEDEVFTSNRRRQQRSLRDPATGLFARRVNVPPPPVNVPPPHPPVSLETFAENGIAEKSLKNEPCGKILPPSTAIDCRPPRQMVTAHGGKILPSPPVKGFRGGRQTVTGVGGNRLPLSAANGFRGERQTVADNGETQVGGRVSKKGMGESPTPPENAFERWSRSLDGQFPSALRALERKIRARLETTTKPVVREGLKRQLKEVSERLLPTIPDEPATATGTASPAPAKLPQAKRMSPDQVKENWEKAKKISNAVPA